MFRSIPTVTKNLLIINILVFLATIVLEMQGISLTMAGGLHFVLSPYFHVWQFITYMFLHGGWMHLFGNMFALWMFGSVIERVWGPRKFLVYYLICGIGAACCQELVQFLTGSLSLTVGASGAIYAILLAFGMTFPEDRIFIFPLPVPVKAKYFVMGYIAIELYLSISSMGDGVAHTAHLGGMFFGYLLIRYWRRHPDADYNLQNGRQFFDRLKRNYEQHRQPQRPDPTVTHSAGRQADMEYNARKKQNQDEIDAILDKIHKSGYDSLTKEEKRKLFEGSRS